MLIRKWEPRVVHAVCQDNMLSALCSAAPTTHPKATVIAAKKLSTMIVTHGRKKALPDHTCRFKTIHGLARQVSQLMHLSRLSCRLATYRPFTASLTVGSSP